MNIYEVFFLMQFLIAVGLLLLKFYNLMRPADNYTIEKAIITFIGYFLAYGVGFVVLLANAGEEVLYSLLFRLETWFIGLIVLFFIIEVIYLLKELSMGDTKKAFSSNGR